MKQRIYLAPKGLKQKAKMRVTLEQEHAKAVEAGGANIAALTPWALTGDDFALYSGRVVLLRPLDLAQCEAAEKEARGRMTATNNGIDFVAFRVQARLRRMIVGVSEPHQDPRSWEAARLRMVTQADLEGLTGTPAASGVTRSNGLSFDELFTNKDRLVLKKLDQEWHEVPEDDIEDILGNSIPTAD